MKKTNKIIFSAILMMIVMACSVGPLTIDFGGGSGSSDNEPEVAKAAEIDVGINTPANGATLPSEPVEIAYYGTSTDGVIALELSVDGEVMKISENTEDDQLVITSNYTWEPTVQGSHTIRVRAMSQKGAWSDYVTSTVNVEAALVQVPAEPQATKTPEATETPSATATPDEMTIFNVEWDRDIFYYAKQTCGSREITISAEVTQPEEAYAAILFIRFWDQEGEGLTPWDSGRAMSDKGDGKFSVTLYSEAIPKYADFDFSVMYIQIKVQDKYGNILAGTDVIKEIELHRCTN